MANRINQLMRIVRAMYCTKFGYVLWVPEYNGLHYCMSFEEHSDWINQYPVECTMQSYYRGQMRWSYSIGDSNV